MDTKRCSKCKQEFPATREYFNAHKQVKDGLRSICKQCRRAQDKNYHVAPLNDTHTLKRCTGCKIEYPATTEHFYPLASGRYGLTSRCRSCTLEQNQKKVVEVNIDPNILKSCSKCGTTYPATIEYFTPTKGGRYGLTSQCKLCRSQNTQKWRDENPDKVAEQNYNYYWEHRDYLLEKNREWHQNNKECRRASHRAWYVKNAAHSRKKRKYWYAENTDRAKEYDRQRYIIHGASIREYSRQWRLNNPEKSTVREQRRRAREMELPATLTRAEWRKAVDYWHGKCAYCGDAFGNDKKKKTLDHYIPVSHPNCPGTVAKNCVPVCLSCNTAKGKKDAMDWFSWQFGDRKAEMIAGIIQVYFDSLK
ncbi:MAG: HNH endonuclease signature motif containing protein [Chloroflexota bacterium]